MAGKKTHIINADYPHSKRALLGKPVAITDDNTDKIFLLVNGIQEYVTMNYCLVSVNLHISVKHRLPCKPISSLCSQFRTHEEKKVKKVTLL